MPLAHKHSISKLTTALIIIRISSQLRKEDSSMQITQTLNLVLLSAYGRPSRLIKVEDSSMPTNLNPYILIAAQSCSHLVC